MLVPPYYNGMVRLHRDLGDLIDVVWLQDIDAMSCQLDPYCVLDMTPTLERYTDLERSIRNDTFPTWKSVHPERKSSKWIWSQSELDAIPVQERGTIPLYKIFIPSAPGARPGDGGFAIPDSGKFSFNLLGPEWTISPFRYPGHTWMPFSLEKTCKSVSQPKKTDRVFILGQKASIFYSDKAPDPTGWTDLATKVGLRLVAAASPDKDDARPLPKGVERVGPLNSITFSQALAESRAMIGIGNPFTTPTPFEAMSVAFCPSVLHFKLRSHAD